MDSLHSIIKSLSKSEKRYFTIYAAAFKEDSEQLKLFEVMDGFNAEDYDDAKAAKKAGIKNITSAKSKLRKVIMRAMRNYNDDGTQNSDAYKSMLDLQFYAAKGLLEEMRRDVAKLEKITRQNEGYNILAELQVRKFYCAEPEKNPEKLLNYYNDLINNLEEAAEGMASVFKALILQSKATKYLNISHLEAPLKRETTIYKLLDEAKQALAKNKSFRGLILLNDTIGQYYSQLGQYSIALQYHEAINKAYNDNPDKRSPWNMYFSMMTNYMVCATNSKNYELAMELIDKIRATMQEADDYFELNSNHVARLETHFVVTRIKSFSANKDHKALIALKPEVEQCISIKNLQPGHVNVLLLNYIAALHKAGENDMCIDFINTIYAHDEAKLIKVNYLLIRLIEVLAFFDQQLYDLAGQKALNLYKTLLENEAEQEVAKVLGQFLRKLPRWNFKEAKTRNEAKEIIDELKRFEASYSGFYKEMRQNLNLIEWLENKL